MTHQDIESFVTGLEGIQRLENMGYVFFFVGDEQYLPVLTIAYADNEGDSMSNLDREGIFRVNIGIGKEAFSDLFPDFSPEAEYDYTALDVFMPHPHYARQFYICILNPSKGKDEQVKALIQEAHSLALARNAARS